MRIAFLSKEESFGVAGVGAFNEQFRLFLEKHGHNVLELRFSSHEGENYIRLPYYFSGTRTMVWAPKPTDVSILTKYIKKFSPEVFYGSAGTSSFDFIVPLLCQQQNVASVSSWHGDFNNDSFLFRNAMKVPFLAYLPYCRSLDGLHVLSDNVAKFYEWWGVEKERVKTIPNGVDTEFYRPGKSDFAKKHGIKNGVLFLGRVTKVKRPELVMESFLAMKPYDGEKLVVVGDGEMLSELRQQYRSKDIIFTGSIADKKQKLDIIRSCQTFVLPSVYEGMSLSLLEAMSVGLKCISTDVGNHKEVMHGVGEILPTEEASVRLPKVLKRVMRGENMKKFGGSRERVVKNYSQRKQLAKLENFLLEVASKRQFDLH